MQLFVEYYFLFVIFTCKKKKINGGLNENHNQKNLLFGSC